MIILVVLITSKKLMLSSSFSCFNKKYKEKHWY